VLRAAVSLARALRTGGMSTSVDSQLVFCRALGEIDVRRRRDVYWAARCTFVHDPEERERFDVIFERFWSGDSLELSPRSSEHGESDPRMTGPRHGGQALPQFRQGGESATPVDGARNRASREIPIAEGEEGRSEQRRGVLAAYSPDEVIARATDFSYAQEELLAVRRLAEAIKRSAPQRCSRREHVTAAGSRLDLRATVRGSLQTDGEALKLAYRSPGLRPRRLVLICDVSGSMERYSRVLLGSLKAAIGGLAKAEAFVFATRLTRLTRSLSTRDLERALELARAAVPDWSGGTRIGHTLAEFNRSYARRGFARGAIVIVVSDGWDRGDPELLADQVRRVQLQARRLVWINPRPMVVDEQPLAIGMRAAMPFIDDFVPGHDPRSMAGLATLIAALESGRPHRRYRPTPRSPVRWIPR
jgi:uncharacterized protein with von Willebrand factor type A (vWA) domain